MKSLLWVIDPGHGGGSGKGDPGAVDPANLGEIGVPIPDKLRDAIEKQRGDDGGESLWMIDSGLIV